MTSRHLAIEDAKAARAVRVQSFVRRLQPLSHEAAERARDGRERHGIQLLAVQQVQQLRGALPVIHLYSALH